MLGEQLGIGVFITLVLAAFGWLFYLVFTTLPA